LEILATLVRLKCAPLLGASFKVVEAPSCVHLGFMVGGSSLENIAKDCWVFPLFEKGFPRILLVFLCMVILLVILVIATLVYGVAAFVYG